MMLHGESGHFANWQSRANLARGATTRLTSPLFRLQETTKLANTQPYTHIHYTCICYT